MDLLFECHGKNFNVFEIKPKWMTFKTYGIIYFERENQAKILAHVNGMFCFTFLCGQKYLTKKKKNHKRKSPHSLSKNILLNTKKIPKRWKCKCASNFCFKKPSELKFVVVDLIRFICDPKKCYYFCLILLLIE